MPLRLSRDAEKPLREHFDELSTRGTGLLFILSISTVIWWTQIDPLLEGWLSALPSSAQGGVVTIYDPHGWMATRWSMIALMALLTTMPFAIHQLLAFSREGLLPSERRWVRNVTVGGGSMALVAAIYWWMRLRPCLLHCPSLDESVDRHPMRMCQLLLWTERSRHQDWTHAPKKGSWCTLGQLGKHAGHRST